MDRKANIKAYESKLPIVTEFSVLPIDGRSVIRLFKQLA